MKKKIAVGQMQVGMFLQSMCGSWTQHPFVRSSFLMKDPHDVRLLVESGIAEVWIDTSKGSDVPAAATEPVEAAEVMVAATSSPVALAAPAVPALTATLAIEIVQARKICAQARESVVSMFQEARMGQAVSAEAAGSLVEEISSSVSRNAGAIISLARLKTADDYTYMHSVAVCAMMVSLARTLGHDEGQVREAGMAGLMHDLGKALVPAEILNKPGKLTDDEFGVVKSHPERGHALLVEGGAASEIVRDVCLHHHEKIDGSGYPHRLKGDAISIVAKMGAICDVYDAITSNRPYKAGWEPAQSIKKMTAWCNGHLDEAVFHAFVKSIGIYPVGSLVRLTSGRLAVVLEQSRKSLLTPLVKVFHSGQSQVQLKHELVDLAYSGPNEKIVSIESPEKWGIKHLEKLWME